MPMALLALLLFVAVPNTFWAVGFNALLRTPWRRSIAGLWSGGAA
ncbi:hypothetical protein EMGBS1_06360 [Chloroflexota bacterium]|nr:hypothetical protein EMGBS1_06360 [Chloroflexota bacterium]